MTKSITDAYIDRMFGVAREFDERAGILSENEDSASTENIIYVLVGEIALLREEFEEYKNAHS